MRRFQGRFRPLLSVPSGLAALAVLLGLWCLAPGLVRDPLRERALDLLLPLLPERAAAAPGVAILDIDHAALARFGPWPWPRAQLARVVAAAVATRPSALGIDILLAGADRFSAAALLDELSDTAGRADAAAFAAALPDGDALLAKALAGAPAVLGFVLGLGAVGHNLPAIPVLAAAPVRLPGIWRADSVIGPTAAVAAAAQGFGAIVAAPDPDAPIRRVPLLTLVGETLRPGLAVEAVRLAQGAGTLLIDRSGRLHIGTVSVPLGPDGTLRLVQPAPAVWVGRTVAASALLDNPALGARLAGRIVLIGSSAPELGGLRVTPASPATPSVQIQAEAIDTLLRGAVASRPAWLRPAELASAAALGLLCLLLAAWLRPLPAAGLAFLVCLVWAGAALAAVRGLSLLVDPAGPALVAFGSFAVVTLVRFARDEWRARLLRASFEQYLAPEVVRRIAADPAAVRLHGEVREITALFTDIEGFTAMTERADPVELVALLDTYFDTVARVVTEHGGMVDKIVGDGLHAIFNAPFALDDHPARAVTCALALLQATEEVRRSPAGCRLLLGRTRIGIETGTAVVGDVGGSRKLDYTAHGSAINTAARLEAANKELGSSICIGPGTAAQLDPAVLRQVGTLTLRGQSRPISVFTPAALDPGASASAIRRCPQAGKATWRGAT
ncbi:MAG TPA: adenylate/guanylate cyclase domain-containing protein [Acetobacteraceae bacterium]|nr:adenylate/guanylate cyclase domain-containing protein [Acetobacteraceae bacterium]